MDVNITYETLFDTLRKEKSSEELQELEDNFYEDVHNYLLEKKGTYQQNREIKTKQQIENSQKIVKEIFERREKKILMLAFNQGRTKVELATNRLLKEEAYFYQSVLDIIKKYNDLLQKSINIDGKEAIIVQNTPQETKKIELAGKKVEFLTNLPKFLGKDLESYGPYKKGDKAELPEQLADILVDKKRARLLSL